MKLHLRLIFSCCLLITILSMIGCDKEDAFKNPTSVAFNLGMDYQGVGGSDELTFSDGYIVLRSFSVIGRRVNAEGFEFTREFSAGLKIPFNNSLTLEDLNFDLPQGDYEALTIRFETLGSNAVNLFLDGEYVYNNPLKTPSTVHLKWNAAQQFEVNMTDLAGNTAFSLTENKLEQPNIIFDVKSWFTNTTEMMLENASFVTNNGKQTMTIDNSTNTNLFNEVNAMVGEALVATF